MPPPSWPRQLVAAQRSPVGPSLSLLAWWSSVLRSPALLPKGPWPESQLGRQAAGGLGGDGVEQRDVLRPLDGQLVAGVVVDDLRDVVERRAVLAQDKLVVFRGQEFHVQEALAAPAREETKKATQSAPQNQRLPYGSYIPQISDH